MSLTEKDLDAIRDRVDRNSFPQGDRARLLAEVDRLREGITSALSTSRDMQADMRSSVTLAFLQDALSDLLYPEGES